MKGLELAVAAGLVYVLGITVLFRLVELRERALVMLGAFLLSLPVFIAAYVLTPAEFGRIPDAGDSPAWLDLLFGLFLYCAGFFGGVLQLYNLAERGFSLRMLIDIDEAPREAMTQPEIMSAYSAGRGIAWMYDKRLQDMLRRGVIYQDGLVLRNSARASRLVAVFGWLRRFMRLAG